LPFHQVEAALRKYTQAEMDAHVAFINEDAAQRAGAARQSMEMSTSKGEDIVVHEKP